MNDTTQHHAYQRGVRMANRWKRVKSTILRWDAFCVAKAQSGKFPRWVGHIPMVFFAVIMLSALVFGGMIIASSAVLIGALVFLAAGILSSEGKNVSENDEKPCGDFMQQNSGYGQYRDGQHGWGWYDAAGRIVNNDDE